MKTNITIPFSEFLSPIKKYAILSLKRMIIYFVIVANLQYIRQIEEITCELMTLVQKLKKILLPNPTWEVQDFNNE